MIMYFTLIFKMKRLLIFTFAILAVVQAKTDWSKVVPLDIDPFQRGELIEVNQLGSRIVGGNEADPHAFPYQVAVLLTVGNKVGFCGGSIISDEYILCAAHCLYRASEAEVVAGAHNIHEDEPTQQRIKSKELIVHKGWHPLFLTSDIGLIKLPEKLQFNDVVQPIRLPCHSDTGKSLAFENATVSGWGKDSDQSSVVSSVLRFVESQVTIDIVCKIAYFGIPGANHLCMSGLGGKSSCNGDSGGPLVTVNENGEPVQQGIVSFGLSMGCEIGWPSCYTKVSSFLKWINKTTGIPICD